MGCSSYPKISSSWLKCNLCLKTTKNTLINLKVVKCIKERSGGIYLPPTFFVWPPRLFYNEKTPFLPDLARSCSIVVLRSGCVTPTLFQNTSNDHSHMTWYSKDHQYPSRDPFSWLKITVKFENARNFIWVSCRIWSYGKSVHPISKNFSCMISKRLELNHWRVIRRLRYAI